MSDVLTDAQLDETLARAGRLCRCDDVGCAADLIQVSDRDVPGLVAEVRRLREGLRILARIPDGQEVVPIEDLRVSGDSSHVVHGLVFIAAHEEDLAARIAQLLNGADFHADGGD